MLLDLATNTTRRGVIRKDAERSPQPGCRAHRWKLLLLLSAVAMASYSLVMYSNLSRTCQITVSGRYQGMKKRAFSLSRDQQLCTTLWQRVGCDSKNPILRCTPFRKRNPTEEHHHDAVVTTFDSLVHLNVCRHDSCSLIGSSGNLKNHERGNLIDKSNVVIRLNNQPVKGYEKYVGKRPADITIFNDHISDCFTNTSHPTLYVRATDSALRKDAVIIKKCQADRIAPLYSMSRYLQQRVQTLLKVYAEKHKVQREVTGMKGNYVHATSGLKALVFSMMICKRVHVFGFGMQGAKTWHYFPPYTTYVPAHHEMSLEMNIIRDIANRTFAGIDLQNGLFGNVTVY